MSERAGTGPTAEVYVSRVDRRTTLAWLGGAAAAVVAGDAFAARAYEVARSPTALGYGTDPDLLHPTAPWPRTLTRAQLQTAALLCDFILPASADAPSAAALGVPDFIDEWVSAPYPAQMADRPVILDGLNWLADEARYGFDLLHMAPAERAALFAGLTRRPSDPALVAPHAFFRRFRSLTIGAYYTTEAGFKQIGYIGNVPLASYPGPSDEVTVVLDRELKKLGL
jgi:hypothetical protein